MKKLVEKFNELVRSPAVKNIIVGIKKFIGYLILASASIYGLNNFINEHSDLPLMSIIFSIIIIWVALTFVFSKFNK